MHEGEGIEGQPARPKAVTAAVSLGLASLALGLLRSLVASPVVAEEAAQPFDVRIALVVAMLFMMVRVTALMFRGEGLEQVRMVSTGVLAVGLGVVRGLLLAAGPSTETGPSRVDDLRFGVAAVLFCAVVVLLVQTGLGKAWARLFYVAMAAPELALAVAPLTSAFGRSALWGALGALQLASQGAACVLLLTGSARQWFRAVESLAPSGPTT